MSSADSLVIAMAVSKAHRSIVYSSNNGIPVRLQFNDGEGGVMLWADVSARPGIRTASP